MPNLVNKMVVKELTDVVRDSSSMVIVSLTGLTMEENESLRDSLAEGGVQLRMVRNSLAKLALKDCGVDMPDDVFQGNVAIALGDVEHAIHAAKTVQKSDVRKAGKVDFRGGVLEGEVLDASRAKLLADMPDRDTLRAKILGCLSGPAQNLVAIIGAPGSALARVIQAHVDEGEDAA